MNNDVNTDPVQRDEAMTHDGIGESKSRRSWIDGLRKLDKWWTILVLLFCVTGVLGVPVLWMSRAYGTVMKLVLTVAVTLYTAFLFWLVYLVWVFAYSSVTDALS